MSEAQENSPEGKSVYVDGHRGMVGSALVLRLADEHCTVLTAPREELDMLRQTNVEAWMVEKRPEVVFLAAAKVGGVHANNTRPAEFLVDNLVIETNIIVTAYEADVEKLVFLRSTFICPKLAPQPVTEDVLLTGPLEPTYEWHTIAEIADIKLFQAYRRQYG